MSCGCIRNKKMREVVIDSLEEHLRGMDNDSFLVCMKKISKRSGSSLRDSATRGEKMN